MSNIPANALDHLAAAISFMKQDIEDTIQQHLNVLRNQVLQDIRQEIYAHERLVKDLLRKLAPTPAIQPAIQPEIPPKAQLAKSAHLKVKKAKRSIRA